MSSGASGEVVHCPNCKEDVPKTLYCLNCGYPLYKEGQPKEEKVEPEVKKEPVAKPEPVKPVEEDAVIMVEEEEKPEEVKVEDTPPPKISPPVTEVISPLKEEPKIETVVEMPTQPVETVVEVEAKQEPSTPVVEPSQTTLVVEESILEPEETITPIVDESPQVAAPSESLSTGVMESKIEAVTTIEENPTPKTFVPDPLTKDLLESLAKNISLKIKLMKLYRDGAIKEETFVKVYEGFTSEGKLWSGRREEIMKKLAAEIEELEDEYSAANDALELLEVRHSIGEATPDEYSAKAPAYRWDIDNFDNLVGERKNKLVYLENISNAFTAAEIKELRERASTQYNTLESLQLSNDDILGKMKDDLYEAIKILG
jgi:hypothetical protein